MATENVNYILSLKDLFTSKLKTAGKEVDNFDKKTKGIGASIKNNLGATLGGLAIGAAVVGFGKSVIDSLKNYEYFSASLRVLMKGDASAAKSLQGQLVELAKTTPFSLVDVQDSSKKLLAYGFAAGEIIDQMKMLGDVSAATGNEIGDVAYLYGTLRTQGKAMTKDLYQFTNRGINLIPLLAKHFKILESDVYKFAEQGKISFKDVENAFKAMTSKGGDFFGMMDQQSKTVGGKLSNLGDAWEQLKVNIGKSQTGIVASTVDWANKMLANINRVLDTANKMDEAFSKANVEGFSAIESFNNWLFMGSQNKFINKYFTGGKGNREKLERSLQNMFVKPAARSEVDALKSNAGVAKLRASFSRAYAKGEIGKREFQQSMALFKAAQDEIAGTLNVLKTKTGETVPQLNEDGTPKETTKLGESTSKRLSDVESRKAVNINVSITKLIETQNIVAQNITETATRIKDEVSKALLTMLNDVNRLADA